MDDRFEQEFYKSSWHRVLPLGPNGIQPHVRTDRRSGRLARLPHRLAATLRALAQSLRDVREGLGAFGAFGRWGATGGPVHATLHATRPALPRSLGTLRAAPRTTATGPTRPRSLCKAA